MYNTNINFYSFKYKTFIFKNIFIYFLTKSLYSVANGESIAKASKNINISKKHVNDGSDNIMKRGQRFIFKFFLLWKEILLNEPTIKRIKRNHHR